MDFLVSADHVFVLVTVFTIAGFYIAALFARKQFYYTVYIFVPFVTVYAAFLLAKNFPVSSHPAFIPCVCAIEVQPTLFLSFSS